MLLRRAELHGLLVRPRQLELSVVLSAWREIGPERLGSRFQPKRGRHPKRTSTHPAAKRAQVQAQTKIFVGFWLLS
jgi:hypothetical protein